MSISQTNQNAIFKHFSIKPYEPNDSNESQSKMLASKNPRLEDPQKDTKQQPTNIANRRLGEEFFKNFGKPETPSSEQFYYHRYDDEKDVDAFKDSDGETVYDPYVVMKN
jgi:hypothetical protein